MDLIGSLANAAGAPQRQVIAGGFNTLNNWMSNSSQQKIQQMQNDQTQWNYQNMEKAFTDAGLPSFLAYGRGMPDVPRTMSHLGGTNYQQTGLMGGSFRGVTGTPLQQMMGFGQTPGARAPRQSPRPSFDSTGLPSYGEATKDNWVSDNVVGMHNNAPEYDPYASDEKRQRALVGMFHRYS